MVLNFHDTALDQLKKIDDSQKVLDVGGWHSPWNRANAIIDLMPFETRNRAGALWKETWPIERFSKASYFQQDICSGKPFPFEDKEFDFVMCSNTLEDIRDPIHVCREIVRVGKAGMIEVPSRLAESTRGMERPFYCGWYHHRWLCEVDAQIPKIIFKFKPAMLHAYRRFYFRKPFHKKINPKYSSIGFFWKDSFQFEEKITIERDDVQADLINFKKNHISLKDLFIAKYDWLGRKLK